MTAHHLSPDGIWRVCEAESPATCGVRGAPHLDERAWAYMQTSLAFGQKLTPESVKTPVAPARTPQLRNRLRAPLAPVELTLGPANPHFKVGETGSFAGSFRLHAIDTRLHVAPAGFSGKFCDCGTYFKQEAFENATIWGEVRCPGCDKTKLENEMLSDLCHSELKYLQDDTVRTAHWFHVTERADWVEGTRAEGIITHLGSREAAHHRLSHIVGNGEAESEQFYVYEVRLKSQATITPGLLKDQVSMWPEDIHDIGFEGSKYDYLQPGGVARYLNEYEGPGTISLVADPNAYEIVGRATVPTGS